LPETRLFPKPKLVGLPQGKDEGKSQLVYRRKRTSQGEKILITAPGEVSWELPPGREERLPAVPQVLRESDFVSPGRKDELSTPLRNIIASRRRRLVCARKKSSEPRGGEDSEEGRSKKKRPLYDLGAETSGNGRRGGNSRTGAGGVLRKGGGGGSLL